MAFDNNINEVYDYGFSCSNDNDEIDDLYNKLYDLLIKADKDLKNKLSENIVLHERIKKLKKKNHDSNTLAKRLLIKSKKWCEYEIYIVKNNELSRALQGFKNNKNKLNDKLNG